VSLIRVIIRLSEDSRYYQVRHSERICLLKIYLHPSTYYSVSTQTFHTSSTPSQLSRYMNINMLSIDYPVWVCLRPRLTLIRLALIRKPWSSGVRVSHPHYRYLCLHLLFQTLQHALRHTFDADWNAPLPVTTELSIHSFGNMLDARLLSMPDRSTSELLRTL
jgi:hypothetical protein